MTTVEAVLPQLPHHTPPQKMSKPYTPGNQLFYHTIKVNFERGFSSSTKYITLELSQMSPYIKFLPLTAFPLR